MGHYQNKLKEYTNKIINLLSSIRHSANINKLSSPIRSQPDLKSFVIISILVEEASLRTWHNKPWKGCNCTTWKSVRRWFWPYPWINFLYCGPHRWYVSKTHRSRNIGRDRFAAQIYPKSCKKLCFTCMSFSCSKQSFTNTATITQEPLVIYKTSISISFTALPSDHKLHKSWPLHFLAGPRTKLPLSCAKTHVISQKYGKCFWQSAEDG